MKNKFETTANVLVITLAVVVASVYLKDRFFPAAAEIQIVKAGDNLVRLNGWDWASHDRTLLLVLRKGCHFCEDSMPFYQRLLAEEQPEARASIVAVFPDDAETVKDFAKSERLDVRTLAGVPLESLRISGTPTLILLDSNGTVLNVWAGMLSPRQEMEVIGATIGPVASASKSPS